MELRTDKPHTDKPHTDKPHTDKPGPDAIDLLVTPLHLGLGATAQPVEGFAWEPDALRAYTEAVAADGSEGRMVMIFDGEGRGDHWERHPAGDEVIVCLRGSVTVVRESAAASEEVRLGAGQATINPTGVWHAVDMDGRARILAITAGLGTEHRPR